MPRPARTDRPVEKNVSLPSSLVAQVDLLLYSELENRIPHGAWAKLLAQLLQDWLDRANRDERLAHQLRRIVADGQSTLGPDAEVIHRHLDLALVSELHSLGYSAALEVFNAAPKHYA